MKKAVCLLLVLGLVVGYRGCSSQKDEVTLDNAASVMEAALEDKYGEDFSVGEASEWKDSSYLVTVRGYRAEAISEDTGIAFVISYSENKNSFADNYGGKFYEDRILATVYEALNECSNLSAESVDVNSPESSENWVGRYEEYLQEEYTLARIYFGEVDEDISEQLISLGKRLESEGISYYRFEGKYNGESFYISYFYTEESIRSVFASDAAESEAEEVVGIRLVDPVGDMYDDPLNILLDDGETQNLLDALDVAEETGGDLIGYFYYALELVDAEGNVISRITIDASGMLKLDSGEVYERTGALDEALTAMEQNHDISTAIWKRVPGENYFGLTQLADNGVLLEFTDNNFIDGKEIRFASEECAELSALLQESVISDTIAGEYKKQYSIELYTEAGASVCLLFADSDFNIYTEQGYPIKNDTLSEYLKTMVENNR